MLTRRAPERSVVPMRTPFERLFGEWPVGQLDAAMTDLAPPIDVDETNDAYEVMIDLPGMKPEDVEILVDGRTVTISGRFANDVERREGRHLLRERRQGEFMRAVALPGMVQVDDATTHFENGELTIILPKAAENRARRIQITNGGQSSGEQQSGMGSQSGGQMRSTGQQGQQDMPSGGEQAAQARSTQQSPSSSGKER